MPPTDVPPIDPPAAPYRSLPPGAQMPAIELGAFGSDHADPEAVADAVSGAYEAASRHFDCAAVYGIDPRVGRLIGSSACGKVGVCFDEGLQA